MLVSLCIVFRTAVLAWFRVCLVLLCVHSSFNAVRSAERTVVAPPRRGKHHLCAVLRASLPLYTA